MEIPQTSSLMIVNLSVKFRKSKSGYNLTAKQELILI